MDSFVDFGILIFSLSVIAFGIIAAGIFHEEKMNRLRLHHPEMFE